MEHGIPLSRRAPLVHIARISREEWWPLVAVEHVRYYISKARFDGLEREEVTIQREPIFSTAAQCISRYEYLKIAIIHELRFLRSEPSNFTRLAGTIGEIEFASIG